MERELALGELPTALAVALRMRDANAHDEAIAAALGIPLSGVPPLLEVARAKLTAVLADPCAAQPGDRLA